MHPSPSHKTSIQREETKWLQKVILQRRREGASFPEIAEEQGKTQGYIYKLYKKALKEVIVEDVIEVRKLEMLKLEALEKYILRILEAFHPLVSGGQVVQDIVTGPDGAPLIDPLTDEPVVRRLEDNAIKLSAIDRAVKLMERRAKLLGLDAPTKVAPTNPNGDKAYAVTVVASPLDQAL